MAADVSSNSDVFDEAPSGVTLGDLKQFIITQRNKTSLFTSFPPSYVSWKTFAMLTLVGGALLSDAYKQAQYQCPVNMTDLAYSDYSSFRSSGVRCVRGLLEASLGLSILPGALGFACEKKLGYYFDQLQVSFFRSPNELATSSDLALVIDELINGLITSSESPLLNKLTPDQLFEIMRFNDFGQTLTDLVKEGRFKNSAIEKLIKLSEKPLEDLESDLANNDVLKPFGVKGYYCDILWYLLLPVENQTTMIHYRLLALKGLISNDEFNKLVNLSKMTLQDLALELSKDDVVEGIKDVNRFCRRLLKILPPENKKPAIIQTLRKLGNLKF